jgi:MoxR-like ATPase
MEERQVTIDRQNYRLPDKFLVIATQNPREFEGTYPLPESQLDRFMLRIDLAYPAREHELAILAKYGNADAHAAQHEPEVRHVRWPQPRPRSRACTLRRS